MKIIGSCANCGFTYSVDDDKYLCIKKNRQEVSGLFLLGRYCCSEYKMCKDLVVIEPNAKTNKK